MPPHRKTNKDNQTRNESDTGRAGGRLFLTKEREIGLRGPHGPTWSTRNDTPMQHVCMCMYIYIYIYKEREREI